MSVGFSVHSIQSIGSAQRSIAFNASSVQYIASVQFLKRSVYRVVSVAYIVNGVQ